jgi:hypothetical protein
LDGLIYSTKKVMKWGHFEQSLKANTKDLLSKHRCHGLALRKLCGIAMRGNRNNGDDISHIDVGCWEKWERFGK